MNVLMIPKNRIAMALFLIFITAIIHASSSRPIATLAIATFSTIISDLIFLKLRKKPLFFPSAAIVSGLIIGLLIDPHLPWYDFVVAAVIAIFSKNFIRIDGRHIFNPAALGLMVSAVIFNHSISWWAVSFQRFTIDDLRSMIFFLILISPVIISGIRMRRWKIIISFLITYTLLSQTLNSQLSTLNSLFDPTVLFFSIVMLPEPMTTPNNYTRQVAFGFIVGLIAFFVSSSIFPALPAGRNSIDPLILALLLGNLLFFRMR